MMKHSFFALQLLVCCTAISMNKTAEVADSVKSLIDSGEVKHVWELQSGWRRVGGRTCLVPGKKIKNLRGLDSFSDQEKREQRALRFDNFDMVGYSAKKVTKGPLEEVPDLIFMGYLHVESLDIASQSVSKLSRNSLAGLKSVRFINLYGNKIGAIDPTVFATCYRLEEINLNDNELDDTLNAKALTDWLPQSLQKLSLMCNKFSEDKKKEIKDLFADKRPRIKLRI